MALDKKVAKQGLKGVKKVKKEVAAAAVAGEKPFTTPSRIAEAVRKKSKKAKKSVEPGASDAAAADSADASRSSATEPVASVGADVPAKKSKKISSREAPLKKPDGVQQQSTLSALLAERVNKGSSESFEPVPLALVQSALISDKSKRALKEAKSIESLFEIQARAFEPIFEGRDVVGKAKTGCGKTLAFCLPIIERIVSQKLVNDPSSASASPAPLALVLAPTRELAKQTVLDFELLGEPHKLWAECLYGGAPFGPQCQVLREGRHLIVATPGRLLDHIGRGTIRLSEVRFLVLDEADEMLNMGFSDDVDQIIQALELSSESEDVKNCANKKQRRVQKLLFSATLPQWVKSLVEQKMRDPVWVDVTKNDESVATNKNIKHKCIFCPPTFKGDTLGDFVKVHAGALYGKTIIFCDSKKEVSELAQHEKLVALGAGVLHGDIPQQQREVTMENFRSGRIKVLVATDVAARGLDVACVDLVINTRPPSDCDSYVHRSGRTGRAGNTGVSIIFYSRSDEYMIRILRRKLGIDLRRVGPPQPFDIVKAAAKDSARFLEGVHQDNIDAFLEQAKTLIAERGGDAEQVLAAAMAGLTGYTKRVQGRSLLSSFEGSTCMLLKCEKRPIESTGKGYYLLRQFLPWELTENGVKGLTLCRDGHSCCFDVPSKEVDGILALELWEGLSLSVPRKLPDIVERGEGDAWGDDQLQRDRKHHQWQKRTGQASFSSGGWGGGLGSGGAAGGKGKGNEGSKGKGKDGGGKTGSLGGKGRGKRPAPY